ncbi:MAG: hypothetical protein R3C16_09655 [Hyphomonadaceae bacterium]
MGGRAADGASALMDVPALVQALAATPASDAPRGEVSMRMPGFSLDVDSDDGEADGGGRVAINIGAGGRSVQVNADDGGPGNGDDRAFIRLTGLDADDVRQLITEADELSPSVQAQMLAELGLEE